MSHFTGLVILTPDYIENHFEPLEDALEKYDENKSVPEYSKGLVSNYDKCFFLRHSNEDIVDKKFEYRIYRRLYRRGKILPYYKQTEFNCGRDRYINYMANQDKEYYVRCFLIEYPELFENFEKEYEEKGDEWNGGRWRINPENGKWEEYSTYNPNSVYDWYELGGRWDSSIKTKDNEFVNECFLEEIDWTDFSPDDYEDEEIEDWDGTKYKPLKDGVKWHFTKNSVPYCLFINGEHTSRGKMGWWGVSSDEKENWNKEFFEIISRLPEKSEVYLIDFHI